jgi:hypothetical protein
MVVGILLVDIVLFFLLRRCGGNRRKVCYDPPACVEKYNTGLACIGIDSEEFMQPVFGGDTRTL